MKKIIIIHGPNLNLLGKREPETYGTMTLNQINDEITLYCSGRKTATSFFQSNHEGAIIDKIHESMSSFDGIVINPGAFTHYSYAIYDALIACGLPAIEIHISDIHSREDFRKVSVIAPACKMQISGKGWRGYLAAIDEIIKFLEKEK